MELECYDLSWRGGGSSPLTIEALVGGGGDKEVLRMPAPFDPYCYIRAEDMVLDPFRVAGCRIGEGAPEGFIKVEADHPGDIRDFRERFAFQTFEADVYFNNRVAINEDVTFLRPDTDDVLYFDIEVDDRGSFAEADSAEDRVIAIAAVGGDGQEYYFDSEDEVELLDGFLAAADDYVALVGWNSETYDFPYLENRLGGLGLSVDWRRWVRHDAMPLYDMLGVPTKTVSTKLGDTGERELGVGKTGVEPGDGRLYELWQSDPDELREYNLRDADLVRRIDEKYGLVDLLHVICDICNYPPGEACYETRYGQARFAIGQAVDAKLLEIAHRRGIPQPNKGAFEKPDDFPGGYVLEPTPGMYEDVVTPDYSGMYPNIVRAWNFGRETWVPDEQLGRRPDGSWEITGGEHEGRRAIKGETGGFVHPDDGSRSVPAEAADELVDMREGAADIVDKGVKAVNNCFSGDTEVMTPDRGPVNIKELEVGDEVYSIDPDTLECEAKPVVDTTAEPNNYGELVHFKGEAVDLRVTPNHRMLSARHPQDPSDPDGFEIREARDMEASEWVFPRHEPMPGVKHETISLLDSFEGEVIDGDKIRIGPSHGAIPYEFDAGDLLEFMGWYISEGSTSLKGENRSTGVVTIHQKNVAERARIVELVDRMGFNHFEHDEGVTISNRNMYEWCRSEIGAGSENKRIPHWVFDLDHTLLERLHGSLMDGDGCDDGRGSVKYTTISDELRDDYARLMVHLGKKMRFREDGAHRVHENRTNGIVGHRNAEREDHDGMVYCVSVAGNHTVLAGRNGIMQWTGQTLYGIFAAGHQRYFGPHSENITLIGQELTGIVEDLAGAGHPDICEVVYGDTDSVMIEMDDPDDPVGTARRIASDLEEQMQEWARERGAFSEYLELDVDDVYDRFYIGDKKKRYFGHRIYDGGPCDDIKIRGFESRQGSWPAPVREFQEDLMEARLAEEPTGPIIEEARDRLESGRWDLEMATSTTLKKPVSEYDGSPPHVRAARKIREHFGRSAVDVGDKVTYIKYGPAKTDMTWVFRGQVGVNYRPNDFWCDECGELVGPEHGHETEDHPHLRESHYGYLWRQKFESVMDSIDVSEHENATLEQFV